MLCGLYITADKREIKDFSFIGKTLGDILLETKNQFKEVKNVKKY